MRIPDANRFASSSIHRPDAFYAVRGILAYLREETKTHHGTRSRFHLRAVYQSDFPSEVAVLWDELRADRQEADYNVWTLDSWDDQAAAEAIDRADNSWRKPPPGSIDTDPLTGRTLRTDRGILVGNG